MSNYMPINGTTWKKWTDSWKSSNLPRLNQEEIEIMNNPIMNTEIKTVIKKSPQKQKPRAIWLHRGILSNIQRRANAYFSVTSQKLQRKEHFQTHSTRPQSPWYQNQKDNMKKENYRPISLMNINAKIHNKILANRIQHIKKLIHHDQVGFIPGMQGFFNICKSINMIHHINKLKNKKHDHLNRCRKCLWQNAAPSYDLNSSKMGIEGSYFNIVKAIYDKPTANIIFNGEKLKAFHLRSGQDNGVHFHLYYST